MADKVAENKKVAEAGAESGEANVEKSLIIFVEVYGQEKVPLFAAFTEKGLLPLLLRKSNRINVT